MGQLGDHDALATWMHLLDASGRAHPKRSLSSVVGIVNTIQPDDLAASRQVRPRNEAHQLVDVGVRVLDQMAQRLDDLHQVVRRAVGGHADRDTSRPIDQQVGKGCGEDGRLDIFAVVVRLEVNGVLVQAVGHGRGGWCHAAFRVTHCGWAVIQRSEVAVTVDEGESHGPRLRGSDERVVDGTVAMRVVLTHDLTDHTGALDVRTVRPYAHLVHRVQDPALHRLEPVPGVRKGP